MKLKRVTIRNFRCCENLCLDVASMHAIVGPNNAGKSTLLHALDLLFNPSTRKMSEESFFQKDVSRRIEIEAIFDELSVAEASELAPYLKGDGTFHLMRTVELSGDDATDGTEGGKYKIQAFYGKAFPIIDWLHPAKISGAAINEWWKVKETLIVHGESFLSFLGGGAKPAVGLWKEKASEFAAAHLLPSEYADDWIPNPQGYAGVLKSTLPHYELIPAVRDALDESRVTKTNPFGRLIYEIVNSLDSELRDELDEALRSTVLKLNRGGENVRAQKIADMESTIKGFLGEIMPVDLELQFQAPTVEVLLTTPKVVVDDGFCGGVDGKGHGLQRAVIFAILRSYAKLVTDKQDGSKRTLILGVEEPELYMHPTAQRTIRRVLRAIADGGDQVLITTHSPLMVDVEYFDEIVRIEAAQPGGSPRPYQLSVTQLIDDLVARYPGLAGKVSAKSIREKYRHAYTSSRNEGFFARTVVLVEGSTEAYALPIYAAAMNADFDALGISVVECGGKGQLDRLYRIFNELGIPCYAIFDYDLGSTDSETRRLSRELLTLFGSAEVVDPQEVVIAPAFACFSKNWEQDTARLIADYEVHKREAKDVLGVRDESKPLVARYIAHKLVAQTPPDVPPPIREIVGRVVAVSRTASCLKTIAAAPAASELDATDSASAPSAVSEREPGTQ